MACRGVLFAIEKKLAEKIESMKRENIVEFIQEEIEEEFFSKTPEYVAELDKSWDAAHRTFSNSTMTFKKEGNYPLNHLILGASVIYGDKESEADYIVTINSPKIVKDIYKTLSLLTESDFREKYFAMDENACGFSLTDEDCTYTWDWINGTIPFWKTASEKNFFVIFTVDQ